VAAAAFGVEDRQSELAKIVGTAGASGRLPGRLNRGQEQADQHGDDRDHDEQLDEGETM
jgi:hypothetical protein